MRVYTPAERRKRAVLLARGVRQAHADPTHIERQIAQLDATAEDRGRRELAAWEQQFTGARNEVAAAKVAERSASWSDKAAARAQRRDAEKRLRQVENARPRG